MPQARRQNLQVMAGGRGFENYLRDLSTPQPVPHRIRDASQDVLSHHVKMRMGGPWRPTEVINKPS